jgi:nucleoside-diphosphate-sugar epimerase
MGTFDGGREKAPAALCRKIVNCIINQQNYIDVWGDGEQTRSFLYIDDCIEGTLRLFEAEYTEPLNIGSDEQVSINQMINIIKDISGIKKLNKNYQLDKPKGVRGRSSDNRRATKILKWSYKTSLKDGLKKTYDWILKEMTIKKSNLSKFSRSY